ncbi:MAG: MSEP-CTERM sorting domain-containing protein [Cryomorphaceae bacterium]|nr:MSEP-CTERM sorting domain-containing protein [Cryomorphaceae bacterium]
MTNSARNPLFAILFISLPLAIMLILGHYDFQLLKTQISDKEQTMFMFYFGAIAFHLVATLFYSLWCLYKKHLIQKGFVLLHILYCLVIVLFFFLFIDNVLTMNLPSWMFVMSPVLIVFTFLGIGVFYGMVCLIEILPKWLETRMGYFFLAGVVIFIMAYIVLNFFELFIYFESLKYVYLVSVVLGVSILLFFLIYFSNWMLFRAKHNVMESWISTAIITLVLPLFGLILSLEMSVFGDFSHFSFFALAILNGILLSLPRMDAPFMRLLIFLGKGFTFAFSAYFFLVFFPFFPISIVLIIFLGIGILMLTPLVVAAIHFKSLMRDFKYLKDHYGKSFLFAGLIVTFLILPTTVTVYGLMQRANLNTALTYLHTPDPGVDYSVNAKILRSSIKYARLNNRRSLRNMDFLEETVPFISGFYQWLVFDRMTLSNENIDLLEQVFLGVQKSPTVTSSSSVSNLVIISEAKAESYYDENRSSWVSQIDLEITNHSQSNLAEYSTRFQLPEGCFVSDYYLDVFGTIEKGQLVEKKSAIWIYSLIRNVQKRDPGLLFYSRGNALEFRVFPFSDNETRKTGFELVHRNPVQFTIDDWSFTLGEPTETPKSWEMEGVCGLVTGSDKQIGDRLQRRPYFHFIIDATIPLSEFRRNQIQQLISRHPDLAEDAVVTMAGSVGRNFKYSENWNALNGRMSEGAFFLERAIEQVLRNSIAAKEERVPVMVVVSDSMKYAIIPDDFDDFRFTYPDGDYYFEMKPDGTLYPRRLWSKSLCEKSPNFPGLREVVAWPGRSALTTWLRDDESDEVYFLNHEPDWALTDSTDFWGNGMVLQSAHKQRVINPKNYDSYWLPLVQQSFFAGVLTPVTAFIVVETDAQREMLARKQAEVLKGDARFDVSDQLMGMSEPKGIFWLLIICGLFWLSYRLYIKTIR